MSQEAFGRKQNGCLMHKGIKNKGLLQVGLTLIRVSRSICYHIYSIRHFALDLHIIFYRCLFCSVSHSRKRK